MPVAFNAQCHAMMQDTAEKRVCGCSEQIHLCLGASSEGRRGRPGQRDVAQNGGER